MAFWPGGESEQTQAYTYANYKYSKSTWEEISTLI
jgi:hypothetical protein